jgi:hypothetical protein
MFVLGQAERVALGALALAAFAGAFATTPIIARSAAIPPVSTMPSVAPIAERPEPVVTPRRDPFAGGVTATPAPQSASTLPPIPAIPALLRPLPPNAGAGGTPLTFSGIRVTAVISGRHPFALVEDGGVTRMVTVGETLDETRVDAIDSDGLRLADGRLLHVEDDHAPLPRSSPTPRPGVR